MKAKPDSDPDKKMELNIYNQFQKYVVTSPDTITASEITRVLSIITANENQMTQLENTFNDLVNNRLSTFYF